MKSINDIRRENLRDIINRDFDGRQVRLAERLEINANVISRWLKPATDKNHKTIGDSVARKLEIAANKPKFWLDRDHMMANTPAPKQCKRKPKSEPLSRAIWNCG